MGYSVRVLPDSLVESIYVDLIRGRRPPGLDGVLAMVSRANMDRLASAMGDPLCFAPFLRAASEPGAVSYLEKIGQAILDELGLSMLRPGDVVRTRPPAMTALDEVFAGA